MDRVQNLTQAYSQAPWRKQLQLIGLFSVILVFAALVAGIYLNVTARAATTGREIQVLQTEIGRLEQSNEDLQSQLAFLLSAVQMEKRARAMGFEPGDPEETLYMLVPGYVTRQPVTLAPSNSPQVVGAPVVPDEYTEPLFEWLRKEIAKSSLDFFEGLP